uniref:Uncharacterized protein n=1 Tax=Meloidogyne enterolobii TaxID=390850 RepID=A0A6V7UZ11_MELEN|nr:unnamed protein product [Meloidogyne enterolobii]
MMILHINFVYIFVLVILLDWVNQKMNKLFLLLISLQINWLQKIQDQNNFISNLKFKNELFNNIYRVSDLKLSRGEEMCLANQVCDSLLLSAPFSTFGFWMAYLLPEGRKIFSIRKQVKTFPFAFDTLNNLPLNWFQIEENLI